MLKDMKEELITFETAKLAKEKGFDIMVWSYYHPRYGLYGNSDSDGDNYNSEEWAAGYYSAPTQALLQKWLRDKNEIYIGVDPLEVSAFATVGYRFTWYACELNGEKELCDNTPLGYLTYEEALEKGLFETLKLV